MPVPVEYNSVRRMSTITVPNHDINFDTYDFQLCRPQNDVKDTFESRELEATYCRDFACCGLILNDLHDLLQHYEECHVRLEEENGLYEDEEETSSGSDEEEHNDDLEEQHDNEGYEEGEQQRPILSGKKRSFAQSNAFDLLTQSAVKKLALATNLIQPINPCHMTTSSTCSTPTAATCFTDEDFLAHAGALLASSAHHLNADKPYKCPVQGCDKAYKNPNGLKYHNQHGHCNLVTDENENVASKPYQCTIGDCGKRYKNLNGLKYHIEHSHVAALNHTLATFGSSFFQQHPYYHQHQFSSLPSSISSTPDISPSSSPELSCLSPIF